MVLEKVEEYKPLAKIEKMKEQNYNMIDNVLNNGAEKANKKEQEHELQENTKKNDSLI